MTMLVKVVLVFASQWAFLSATYAWPHPGPLSWHQGGLVVKSTNCSHKTEFIFQLCPVMLGGNLPVSLSFLMCQNGIIHNNEYEMICTVSGPN